MNHIVVLGKSCRSDSPQTWKANDTDAAMGRVYEYANPYSGQYEYFLLKTEGLYSNFPTDQRNSFQWRSLGGSQSLINPAPHR